MKQVAAVLGLTLFLPTGIHAADMPARTYTKGLPQIYDWTGFYAGANVGVGISRDPATATTTALNSSAGSSIAGGTGVIGGGQLGYNLQINRFVLGVEADIQGSNVKDDRTCIFGCMPFNHVTYNTSLDWFGTVRGRAGLATGSVLTYFTGGFAYGHVETDEAVRFIQDETLNFNQTRTGWTIGSGVETSLGGNWTGKIEYLYLDLGSQRGVAPVAPPIFVDTSLDVHQHIFRAGVNYRFGKIQAVSEPLARWGGLYAGGNAGAALAMNPTSLIIGDPPFFSQDEYNMSPRGFIGGAQIGYNWQQNAFVFGLETDLQGSWQRTGGTCVLICDSGSQVHPDQNMNWLGTTRARLGYAVGESLFYATGGGAYGNVQARVSEVLSAQPPTAFGFSHTLAGYAVGGGIETKFNPFGWFGKDWSAKTEYLYVDLGKTVDTYNLFLEPHVLTSHVQEHLFRSGLNYHFGGL